MEAADEATALGYSFVSSPPVFWRRRQILHSQRVILTRLHAELMLQTSNLEIEKCVELSTFQDTESLEGASSGYYMISYRLKK